MFVSTMSSVKKVDSFSKQKHVKFDLNETINKSKDTYGNVITTNELEKESNKVKVDIFKKKFVEWSTLTKFDCYSKIFMSESLSARIVWLIFFAAFTSLTIWLVSFNIINFFKYEVTSKIEIKTERPTTFPAITICDNDPFTATYSQDLFQNVSTKHFGHDIENMTLLDTFAKYRSITELTKMHVSDPSYESKRKNLGKKFDSLVFSCSFNNKVCSKTFLTSFTRTYFSYDYGNCFQFNSGLNDLNTLIEPNKIDTEGNKHGFSIVLGPLVNSNKYLSSYTNGLIVYIHNQSASPSSSKFVNVDIGKETNIIVGRTFKTMQASPYSECQDIDVLNSEIVVKSIIYVKNKNYVYRQNDCFNICLQRLIIKSCGCYYTKYSNINESLPCNNLTNLQCIYEKLSVFQKEAFKLDCPLECSSVYYDYSISSLSFPNQKFFDILKKEENYLKMVQMNYSLNLSSLETFQKYYLSLNIYYTNLEYTEITEKPAFTPIDLLSQIGGSLGMFLGFSLFHFIELVEIFFIIIPSAIMNLRKKYNFYRF